MPKTCHAFSIYTFLAGDDLVMGPSRRQIYMIYFHAKICLNQCRVKSLNAFGNVQPGVISSLRSVFTNDPKVCMFLYFLSEMYSYKPRVESAAVFGGANPSAYLQTLRTEKLKWSNPGEIILKREIIFERIEKKNARRLE